MSKGDNLVKFFTLPSHPPPGPTFSDWFKSLTTVLNYFIQVDILSSDFQKVTSAINSIKNEVIYECESKADRSTSSVYDRSDYVVRELLRTTRINNILQYVRDTSALLASGKLTINDNGKLLLSDKLVDPQLAHALLVEIPTVLALCFTAQETIGTISISDVIKISSELLTIGAKRVTLDVELDPAQQTIFSAVILMLTCCLDNLKVLNTTLFFSMFEDEKIFQKLIEFTLQANTENQQLPLNNAITCMSAYIQSSQSEPDRKKLESNPEFVTLYRKMMDEVINPKLKESRSNRSQFRSILFFSRSLRV
ncbi:hypothetical protein TRFO_22583 [Tritrichomonas foetus]|uniref:Uncharacterized protein n=1 Tax=Tritrichomonas foetus TaxID=1144522 RepID=A0A1J4KHL7_9EUKA|nr:hypothetical protein TRFO_22583 [Tritrichomonas foetus]|eukprot:OHT08821.1 hypothetical protein TRFO_22583 [Tritrichomonas foetus]